MLFSNPLISLKEAILKSSVVLMSKVVNIEINYLRFHKGDIGKVITCFQIVQVDKIVPSALNTGKQPHI